MHNDDGQEFIALITGHQAMLRAFVISLLPGAPGADDVVQEVNEILWRKRDQFELGTNFRAWALRIARLQVFTHTRQMRKRNWEVFDEELITQLSADAEEMLDENHELERVSALNRCLEKLGERDRELLFRRYWKDQRLQDFAVISGESLSNLKVRLFRLRAALKKCIGSELTRISPGPA